MRAALSALNIILGSGRLNPDAARALAGSTLVGLSKQDGGTRPIAEVLARIVGRAACVQLRKPLDEFFAPNQFGVMAKGGAEQNVHTITAHLAQNPGHALVSLVLGDLRAPGCGACRRGRAPRAAPCYAAPAGATMLQEER